MKDKFFWGILGTANISRTIIDAMKQTKNGVVHAIASRSLDKAEEWKTQYSIAKAFGSYGELIDSGEIDAVYIPLPNSLHAEWTLRAISKGIPVLCEKPIAMNASQAAEILRYSKEKDILVTEAFMYRFHPMYEEVIRAIANGKIGNISTVFSRFTFFSDDVYSIVSNPNLGGGALMDVGCYCVNLSRFITGSEPLRVSAYSTGKIVDETMAGILEFPNGVLAHFETSISNYERHYAEIAGTKGSIIISSPWFPGQEEAVFIIRTDSGDEIIKTPGANCYVLELEDFMDAARNRKSPRWDISDAVNNMSVIDALYKNSHSHQP